MKLTMQKSITKAIVYVRMKYTSAILNKAMQIIVTIALSKAFLLILFILFCMFFRIFFKIKSILLCNLYNKS